MARAALRSRTAVVMSLVLVVATEPALGDAVRVTSLKKTA